MVPATRWTQEGQMMMVDCMTCPVRDRRCDSCVVTVLHAPGSIERSFPAERPLPAERTLPTELPTELSLDAAESRVVSMFVGAGLVNAESAAGLHARREIPRHVSAGRAVG